MCYLLWDLGMSINKFFFLCILSFSFKEGFHLKNEEELP